MLLHNFTSLSKLMPPIMKHSGELPPFMEYYSVLKGNILAFFLDTQISNYFSNFGKHIAFINKISNTKASFNFST